MMDTEMAESIDSKQEETMMNDDKEIEIVFDNKTKASENKEEEDQRYYDVDITTEELDNEVLKALMEANKYT
jgi:hypothetical protein